MREKWASQVRDRQDSGHDIIDDSRDLSKHSWGGRSKGKSKDEKRAQSLFSAGKIEEAALLGLPVAMGVMSERYYFGEDGCAMDPEKSTAWAVKVSQGLPHCSACLRRSRPTTSPCWGCGLRRRLRRGTGLDNFASPG